MADSDDDFEITGASGFDALCDAPHPRHTCLNEPFTGDKLKACASCYCFVCDGKQSDCKQWAQHCEASDTDPRWITERNNFKRGAARQKRREEDAQPENVRARREERAEREEDQQREEAHTAEHGEGGNADEEVEDLFQEYVPQTTFSGIRPHPTVAFETTSLSFVRTPTLDVTGLHLAALVAEGSDSPSERTLSSLQMETVALATARHEQTLAGTDISGAFFLGDGPGVGKGRQVAAVIYEHYLRGRKHHLWVSVSNDLLHDARRDVQEIGCPLKVYWLNDLSATRLKELPEGILFCTYATLISRNANGRKKAAEEEEEEEAEEKRGRAKIDVDTVIVNLDPTRRLSQIVHWMTHNGTTAGDGGLIFDEAHRAKNLCPDGGKQSVTGLCVLELQCALPNAKVVYCSATGCSSVKGMAYMSRLGLWGPGTPFAKFEVFEKAIHNGGPGAMELVALDMKQRGMYLSRILSYQACEFETVEVEPNETQASQYDACVDFWRVAYECHVHAKDELEQIGMKPKVGLMSQFWGTHQRFFKQLCMSIKVPELVKRTKQALADGHTVVIGLQSTGEARLAEAVRTAESEEDLEDFRGLRALLEALLDRFPTKELLAVRKDDEEKEKDNIKDEKEGHQSDEDRVSRSRMPAWLSAARANQRANGIANGGSAGGGGGAGGAGGDSSDSDSAEDVLADIQGALLAKKENKRKLELVYEPILKDMWTQAIGSQPGAGRMPVKKDGLVTALSEAFNKIASLSRDELRARLVSCGVPRASMPRSLRERIEALWANRVGADLLASSALAGGAVVVRAPRARAAADEEDSREEPAMRSLWDRLAKLKEVLLDKMSVIELPENPLDEMIIRLGGVSKVAELTGRKMRRVWENGKMEVRTRNTDLHDGSKSVPMAQVNNREKDEFLSDKKRVAIISEAASSGISLHADSRFVNQRRRVHITIELAWAADEALQQFGRTHRSNQTSAPSYVLLMSTIGGERRFATSVAKRLQALGALTKGDRRASDAANLEVFNYQNYYGARAVDSIMDMLCNPGRADPEVEVLEAVLAPKSGFEREQAPGISTQAGHRRASASGSGPHRGFIEDGGSDDETDEDGLHGGGGASDARIHEFTDYLDELDEGLSCAGITASDEKWQKKSLPVLTFLNRMLGLNIKVQAKVYSHFSTKVDLLIKRAKKLNRFDAGTVDIGARHVGVRTGSNQELSEDSVSKAKAMYYELELDSGFSWVAAKQELQYRTTELNEGFGGGLTGFHESKNPVANSLAMHMLIRIPKPPFISDTVYVHGYRNYSPTKGFSNNNMYEPQVVRLYRQVQDDEAEVKWKAIFDYAAKLCCHGKNCTRPPGCLADTRISLNAFLGGCIMPLWKEIGVVLTGYDVVNATRSKENGEKRVAAAERNMRRAFQICRVRITSGALAGQRLVGIRFDHRYLDAWSPRLKVYFPKLEITNTDRNGQPVNRVAFFSDYDFAADTYYAMRPRTANGGRGQQTFNRSRLDEYDDLEVGRPGETEAEVRARQVADAAARRANAAEKRDQRNTKRPRADEQDEIEEIIDLIDLEDEPAPTAPPMPYALPEPMRRAFVAPGPARNAPAVLATRTSSRAGTQEKSARTAARQSARGEVDTDITDV